MKRIIASFVAVLLSVTCLFADDHQRYEPKCAAADNIIGKYFIDNDGQTSNVKCCKAKDGTYFFQMYDMPLMYDKDGKVQLDVHNPNKALRSKPANEIVIIWDLKYDAEDKRWEDGTIYDPRNGITATATVDFVDGGSYIRVRGSVMGIGKNVYWKVVK